MRPIIRALIPMTVVLAALLPAGGALAGPPDIQRGGEISQDINTCNGENVLIEGEFQIITKEQKDGSFIQHLTLHAKGVGDQGNEYVLNVAELNVPEELTQRRVLVSLGSAPNQNVLIRLDNTTGGIFIEVDCQG